MGREIIFLVITLVAFAVWGLPNLQTFLRLMFPGKIRSEFEEQEIDPADYARPVRDLIDALTGLGFHPLGIKVENPPTGAAVWDLSFAAADHQAFASIHSLDKDEPHYYFYTPFQDGAVVLTSDARSESVKTPIYVRQAAPDRPMEEVLQVHQKAVKKMTAAGHTQYDRFDHEARVQATTDYYANPDATAFIRKLRWKALGNFASSLGLVILAGLFLAYRFVR
ncbi:MAG: hypothetical protein JWO38_5050 [Gemmataceae bacterium]|nr:hypothetical protein [Gemmataceae bacterium]